MVWVDRLVFFSHSNQSSLSTVEIFLFDRANHLVPTAKGYEHTTRYLFLDILIISIHTNLYFISSIQCIKSTDIILRVLHVYSTFECQHLNTMCHTNSPRYNLEYLYSFLFINWMLTIRDRTGIKWRLNYFGELIKINNWQKEKKRSHLQQPEQLKYFNSKSLPRHLISAKQWRLKDFTRPFLSVF